MTACAGCICCVAILIGAPSAQIPKDVTEAASQLESERSAARNDGLPLTSEQLHGKRLLATQNAAFEYQRYFDWAKSSKDVRTVNEAYLEFALKRLTGTKQKQLERALSGLDAHLKPVRRATALKKCDFGWDFNRGAKLLFPEFSSTRSLARAFLAGAIFDARKGRFRDSANGIRFAIRLSSHIGQQPGVMALLTQEAVEHMIRGAAVTLAKENAGNSAALTILQAPLNESKELPNLRHTLEGELVMGRMAILNDIQQMSDIAKLSGENEATGISATGDVKPWKRAFEARLLQYWRRVFAKLPKEPHAFRESAEVLKTETESEERHGSAGELSYFMNMVLLLNNGVAESVGMIESNRVLALEFIRVLLFRTSHGAFPASLEELGPVPRDPMDGNPIRYKQTAKGFLLYSVGRDGKDNGGARNVEGQPTSRDLVVEFP